MKHITVVLITLLSFSIMAGPGGGQGGPKTGSDLLLSAKLMDQVGLIDNIELGDEIKFPRSNEEKLKLLKSYDVQSVQLIDGTIILNR